ncbi:PAS domain-containing protein [Aquamicrobium sp. NLF2-7]|uniref:sensor histidine kinase n=1 Tax=Aquamicrobium sp. NLF2-7 TaxID=2918753 RepID=UPI001EFB98D2|nr:PAS domain-containing protein [Aquamicrobium sp. NLF2-7]MCG8271970.1 PAS domain-containing protein [Aquamicrobium sp. NLF2-7]
MPASLTTSFGKQLPAGIVANRMLGEALAFDWSKTAAGAMDDWPMALRVMARTVLGASAPMSILIGRDGLVLYNDTVSEIFGDTYLGSIGRPITEVLTEAADFYRRTIDDCYCGKSHSYKDQPLKLRRNGNLETAWFNLDFSPIRDEFGMPCGVLLHSFETTERVTALRARRRADERLSIAISASGLVGIWDLDVATLSCTGDQGFALIYGVEPEVAVAGVEKERMTSAIHAEDRHAVLETLYEAIELKREFRCQYRVVSPCGKVRWVMASGRLTKGTCGLETHMIGVVLDVTEQMETAAALAESEFRFDTLTDTLPQIVWSATAEGVHDYFSKRWFEFTGIPEEEALNTENWVDLLHPDDQDRVMEVWRRCLTSGDVYDIEYRFRSQSGEYRWMRVMALPQRDGRGRLKRWFGTATDIHESRMGVEQRDLIARELNHRIKNIFSIVGGMIGLSMRERPDMKEFAEELRGRLLALNDAHDFIRPDDRARTAQRVSHSFQKLLQRLLKPYDDENGQRISIEGPDARIDAGAATPLALVFHELATNSAKYGALSTPGGNIRVRFSRTPESVSIEWAERGGMVRAEAPDHAGFGTRLLTLSVEAQLRGSFRRHWEPDGVRVEIEFPLHMLDRTA